MNSARRLSSRTHAERTTRWLLTAVLLAALMLASCNPTSTGEFKLSASEQRQLLQLARTQLVASATGDDPVRIDPGDVPRALRQHGAAFVSLSLNGMLRGCMIDQLDAHEALFENVLRNTQLAAQADGRFEAVQHSEIDRLRIEITIVTNIRTLSFEEPDALLDQLTPGVDGVILSLGSSVSTYMPSVWEIFPEKAVFLSQLCVKAGWDADRWRTEPYPIVKVYRSITFSESS